MVICGHLDSFLSEPEKALAIEEGECKLIGARASFPARLGDDEGRRGL